MPLYMTQFSYSPEAWAALAKKPENRTEAVSKLCQQFGARLAAVYYSFGEYDGFIIVEAPNEVTMTAAIIAALAPGHVRATKTTVLLTAEQAVEAMRKAGGVAFRGPGG
ncbi:MAG TPA: GYD domain-containing protein [Methylomirabilota bacterium]|jgi:uncharacterized protein with GYD domain|nr:GYD domain-containing protein [Methylomirabilota bacterium]